MAGVIRAWKISSNLFVHSIVHRNRMNFYLVKRVKELPRMAQKVSEIDIIFWLSVFTFIIFHWHFDLFGILQWKLLSPLITTSQKNMSAVFLIVARMLLFQLRVVMHWMHHAENMVQKHAHPKEWLVNLKILLTVFFQYSILVCWF